MKGDKRHMKQVISLVLTLAMIFTSLPISVFAVEKSVPDGTPIRTEQELKNMKLDDDAIYYLANDIELTEEWTTLPEFRGILDGNGHKITGLNVTKPDIEIYGTYETHRYGLFSKITASAEVRNLGIEGKISISYEGLDKDNSYINAGLLAGVISNDYYNPTNSARVKNIWTKGEIESDSNFESQAIGALVGIYNAGIADNCYTSVKDTPIISRGTMYKFSNMYYDENLYTGTNNIKGVIGKTTDFMKSNEFVELLNANVGDNPSWILVEGDTPRQSNLNGSPNQPVDEVKIYTEDDLLNINNNLSGNYILMNDIELTLDNWSLIGSSEEPFSGTLDGNGYKIKNLRYSGNDTQIGLIAYSTGVVKNIGIENANITATGWKADEIGTIVGANYGTIENCYVINTNIEPKYATLSGLIAGRNREGSIKNCYAVGKGTKYPIAVGSSTFENCYYDKDVFEKNVEDSAGRIAKSTEEMKTQEFVDLLNSNKGENLEWNFIENNYPTIKNKSNALQERPNEEAIENNNILINELTDNIVKKLKDTTDPWAIMSVVASGNKSELTNIKDFNKEAYTNIKDSIGQSATTIERYIIGLSAVSKDAQKLSNGIDTLNAIEGLGSTNIDAINSMVFALIAYDSGNYEIPTNSKYTKEEIINTIISKQTSKGGWAFSGRIEDIDITAMTVSALAPYYVAKDYKSLQISEETYNKVKTSVNKAIDFLSEVQLEDGSYSSDSNPSNSNSNSTSMVIVALSALGIDVQRDVDFIKNGKNVIDGLLKFKTDDSLGFGFRNNEYNPMATEQGLRAIVSYSNFSKDKQPYNIYTFNKGFIEEPEIPETNEKPVISGVEDITINVGDKFDPTYGVSANDKEDDDLTSQIVINGEVDTTKAGTYKLIYTVTDSDGNTTTREIIVTVIEKTSKKINVGIYTDEKSIYESIEVDYYEGDTAYTVLKRLLGDKVDSTGKEDSLYVKGIDGLYEFDKGPQSGWVYSVNRVKPTISAGVHKINPGDELIWHYTLDLGNDIEKSYKKFDDFLAKQDISSENKAPVINANDVELTIGDKFNPMENVTATDKEDGDLTTDIKIIENTVDSSKEGTYKVVYEVEDSENLKTSKEIKVVVKKINGVEIEGGTGEKSNPVKVSIVEEDGLKTVLEKLKKENKITILNEPVVQGDYIVYKIKLSKITKANDIYLELKLKNTDKMKEIFNQYIEEPKGELSSMIKNASNWILENTKNPGYQDEWKILGLKRGNIDVPSDYYETYYNNLVEVVKEKDGNLNRSKYTEYSRVIIALTALGYDPTDVGGYNLVEKLFDLNNVSKQGINGVIFALIALDIKDFQIKGNANSRDMMIDYIIGKQLSDGGFALYGDKGEVDITAMAIQALAKYKDRTDVKLAIDKALNFLSNNQMNTGGFGTDEGETVESSAQVLVALNALGINENDERFLKNGNTIVDAIKRFEVKDGGFKHLLSQDISNSMATEQVLYSLVSQQRLNNGQTSLYDMSDVVLIGIGGGNETTKPNDNNQGNDGNEITQSGDNNQDNNVNQNNQSSNNNQENEKNPQTSDYSIIPLAMIALISLVGIDRLNRKRIG